MRSKPIIDIKNHQKNTPQTNYKNLTHCKERRKRGRTFNAEFEY